MQKVWNLKICISKGLHNYGSYQSVAHTFCGLFYFFIFIFFLWTLLDLQQEPEQYQSPETQRANDPAVMIAGPVFIVEFWKIPSCLPVGMMNGPQSGWEGRQ